MFTKTSSFDERTVNADSESLPIHNISNTGTNSRAEGCKQIAVLALVIEPASSPAPTLLTRCDAAAGTGGSLVAGLALSKSAPHGLNELSEVFIRRCK